MSSVAYYRESKLNSQLLDLRQVELPFCDADAAYGHPNVEAAQSLLNSARVIIVATPIYNFDVNAAAKNLVELTGDAWENKVVGFLCAAGGSSSYMSVMGSGQQSHARLSQRYYSAIRLRDPSRFCRWTTPSGRSARSGARIGRGVAKDSCGLGLRVSAEPRSVASQS